ncbi:MAG TPA: formylglycine-generating enzyme family protein [Bdellovibrionales bacterium]|nr:formylglycine-generating enzyme family protein [Bdellovibrionales bacterium]
MITAKASLYRRHGVAAALIVSLFAFDRAFASAEQTCSAAILSESVATSEIDKTIRSLAALRLKLDTAKAEGSDSIAVTALASEYRKKEKAFVAYLEQTGIMTREALVIRMKEVISSLQERPRVQIQDVEILRHEQTEGLESNAIDGTHAIFHRIEPGPFKRGEVGEQVDAKITKPFEMMATPTTQIIWRKVAELANAKLGYEIRVSPSGLKGEKHPVERVHYQEVKMWLEALNRLSASGDSALVDVIPSHKSGDVYRLPTEAEWEFVVRGRGQYNDVYHFGNDESLLGDYAWYDQNSKPVSHPVAQKVPVTVDGNEFFDMYGNVWEWVNDGYQSDILGGDDPEISPKNYSFFVLRGGLSSSARDVLGARGSNVGFRFVRTAKEATP